MLEYTPLGKVPSNLFREFCNLAGIRKKPDGDWLYLSEEVTCWHLNLNDNRRANESNLIKSKIYIPIRSYNMEIALYLAEKKEKKAQDLSPYQIIPTAIQIIKSQFTLPDGQPTYYPSQFPGNESGTVTYGTILKQLQPERRDTYHHHYQSLNSSPQPIPNIPIKTF